MKKFFLVLFIMATSFKALCVIPQAKPVNAKPKIKIVTTLSVLKSLAQEIGGERVIVDSLSGAADDPHSVKAKPTFKRLVHDADLFIKVGRSLELWVPQVIDGANNPKLSPSSIITASLGIRNLEIPTKLSRESGDVHPEGNPHVWLAPMGALKMAENIKNALIAKDPSSKAIYEANFNRFKNTMAQALFGADIIKKVGSVDFLFRLHEGKRLKSYATGKKVGLGGWLKQAAMIDYPFITYHSVWSYLADEFGLSVFAHIEEKAGVEPSAKYRIDLVQRAKAANVKRIIAASYYVGHNRIIDVIAKEIGGQKLFVDVDSRPGETYVAMMNRIVNAFVDHRPRRETAPPVPSAPKVPPSPSSPAPRETPSLPRKKNG